MGIDFAFESAMEIVQFYQEHNNGSFRILLCGPSEEVIVCADMILANLGDPLESRIIVAVDDPALAIQRYLKVSKIRVVEWKEEVYEEHLIDRVAAKEDWPIRVVVDFTPSLRRLHRIYKVTHHNSIILLRDLEKRWMTVSPALFEAFRERNSSLKSLQRTKVFNFVRLNETCVVP